mgnify:CR=1 FL=1
MKVANQFRSLKEDNWQFVDAAQSIEEVHANLCGRAEAVIATSPDTPLGTLWTE